MIMKVAGGRLSAWLERGASGGITVRRLTFLAGLGPTVEFGILKPARRPQGSRTARPAPLITGARPGAAPRPAYATGSCPSVTCGTWVSPGWLTLPTRRLIPDSGEAPPVTDWPG
jgi:hypothetical protein